MDEGTTADSQRDRFPLPRLSKGAHVSDCDLFSDPVLLDPYPVYEELRERCGVVWLERFGGFLLTRFDDVQSALADAHVFCSGQGVSMNDKMNEALRGGLLCSDGAPHDVMRKVLFKPLATQELRELKSRVHDEAEALVARVVAEKRFDAAAALAQHLPVTIVSDLVGLPEEGRERMLVWAAANFDCFGPMNKRTTESFPIVEEMVRYAFGECVPGKLKPGGWAQRIWDAADRGEIRHEQCPSMMNDYMGPSLDTTIYAIQSAVRLFAENPDQWTILREDPKLMSNAVNEVLRIESPLQLFTRAATADVVIDGVAIPAGSRIIVSYGAANRDPRKWEQPDEFRVRRKATDQVAFGHGAHRCIGANLARLEMFALFSALAPRVRRFELHHAERSLNNVLRGHSRLDVSLN